MKDIGGALTQEQRIAVADYLTAPRKYGDARAATMLACAADRRGFDFNDGSEGALWGQDEANTRFIPAARGAIPKAGIARLELEWAFAFPGASRVRSQPALIGGAAIMGSHGGHVYALDRATGCLRWRFDAAAEVQTGIVATPGARATAMPAR
jgi:polyvinyl alcohol dehydrogenase (cytochrome)